MMSEKYVRAGSAWRRRAGTRSGRAPPATTTKYIRRLARKLDPAWTARCPAVRLSTAAEELQAATERGRTPCSAGASREGQGALVGATRPAAGAQGAQRHAEGKATPRRRRSRRKTTSPPIQKSLQSEKAAPGRHRRGIHLCAKYRASRRSDARTTPPASGRTAPDWHS